MFKFLKTKIKEAVKKFSSNAEKVEEVVETEIVQGDKVQEEIREEIEEQQEERADKSEEDDSAKEDVADISELVESESLKKPEPFKEPVVEEFISEEPIEELISESENEDLIKEPLEEIIVDDSEPEVIELHSDEVAKMPSDEDSIPIPDQVAELLEEAETKSEVKVDKDVDDLFSSDEVGDDIKKDIAPIVVEESELVNEEPSVELESNVEEISEVKKELKEISEPIIEDIQEVEEISEPEAVIEETEPVVEVSINEKEETKPGFFKRIFGKKEESISEPEFQENLVDELAKDVVDEVEDTTEDSIIKEVEPVVNKATVSDLLDDDVEDATKKKKGFFAKIKEKVVKFQLNDEVFEDLFWDFELALLENNVALEVIEKIKSDLKEQLTQENISRGSVDQVILDTLKNSLDEVLTVDTFDFIKKIQTKKPYIITMVGVNGSGKTTTLAKLIHLLQKKGLSVVVAASDTFRAAAIQQLEEHTNKLGVKLIKHDYNADPSAVAFDAISHAKAKNIDVVLIDTAGRLQSNTNLMDELKKLIRVNKPDLNIFIGESVTGNDCVEQAMAFNEAVGIDGIILSKADIDEKGGAAISVSYVTKKPILYLGTGQTYDDLKPFRKEEILDNLGL